MPTPSRMGISRTGILLPIFVVLIAGAAHLPTPLHGDAVLYQSGARMLAEGGALYRDFWDLKQPGIYVFHWVAGEMFGFGEVGLHALELLCFLAVSVLQILLLRRVYSPPWIASFVPIASFGTYYSVTSDWHLTQPAVLLSAPLFVVLAVASFPSSRPRAAWFAAGVAGVACIALKIATAPLVFALLGAGLVFERREHSRADRDSRSSRSVRVRDRILPAAAGAILAGGALVLWLQVEGGWDRYVWTQTTWFPDALAARGAHPIDRVFASTIWFGKRFAPWIALCAVAPFAVSNRSERIFLLSAIWVVWGTILVMIEPFAGWEFDYLMLIVPIAILSLRGLQAVLEHGSLALRPGAAALAFVLVAGVPGCTRCIPNARESVVHAKRIGGIEFEYQRAIHSRYEAAWKSTAFLRTAEAAAGTIYVFGDPIITRLAGRPHASAMHGWACEVHPHSSWRSIERDLRVARPSYIFVGTEEEKFLDTRGRKVRELLLFAYVVRERTPLGTWYEAKPASSSGA